MKNPLIIQELNRIASRNGGILKPDDVVQEAKSSRSPLHSWFNWDNDSAAHAYRLEQARKLIRITISVISQTGENERIWVNLKSERGDEDSGYRTLVSVLSDSDLRNQLLNQAMEDMEYFTEKYNHLTELSDIFSAFKNVKVKTGIAGK